MQLNIPSLTNKRGQFIDQYGIDWNLNSYGFRTMEFDQIDFDKPRMLAMGCSHTMGNGNALCHIWPEVLKELMEVNQIINLGQEGASSDYVVRILPECLEYFKPEIVFVFWPDYGRFEIIEHGSYRQILPTDRDRLEFIKTHSDEWLINNYQHQLKTANSLCNKYNARLIGISWDDLIPVLDHADRWGISVDGSHYDRAWHKGVAETFKIAI